MILISFWCTIKSMDNYQRALNYETVVSVLKKADNFCWQQFQQIGNECDVREDLPYNINAYAHVLGVDATLISDCYSRCRRAFEKLNPNAMIIDQTHPLWPTATEEVPFLYLLGNSGLLRRRGISVVGTRNPSNRGMQLAREVVDSLGSSGFNIISGLAMGIDGVAHIESLAKDYNTIGVIGTSLCNVYPKQHERLQSLVAEHGLLVSQFAPSRETQQYFFMQRNLLMSQMSQGSFVIEDRDGGGGVKQAQYSEKQGKHVFLLKETYDNRTYLWPRRFKDPVIIANPHSAGSIVKRSVQISRAFGRKTFKDEQPTLF